jgi:hypothetical protein
MIIVPPQDVKAATGKRQNVGGIAAPEDRRILFIEI